MKDNTVVQTEQDHQRNEDFGRFGDATTPGFFKSEAELERAFGKPSARDWPEDFPDENGHYSNRCTSCGEMFVGHKRRVTCKQCVVEPTAVQESKQPDSPVTFLEFQEWLASYLATVNTDILACYDENSMIDAYQAGAGRARSTEQAEQPEVKQADPLEAFLEAGKAKLAAKAAVGQPAESSFHAQALAIVKRHAAEADVDEALVDDIARELEMASVGSALLPNNAFLEALADEPVDLAAAEQSSEQSAESAKPDLLPRAQFLNDLISLINRCSMENGSDTPDFILAQMLGDMLAVFDGATRRRERWYGRERTSATETATADIIAESGQPIYCPFRGEYNADYDGAKAVKCSSCGASGPDFASDSNTAITRWNQRTAQPSIAPDESETAERLFDDLREHFFINSKTPPVVSVLDDLRRMIRESLTSRAQPVASDVLSVDAVPYSCGPTCDRPDAPSEQAAPVASCVLGEPLMHGPQPYRWCVTHNRLFLACEQEGLTLAVAAAEGEAEKATWQQMGNAEVAFEIAAEVDALFGIDEALVDREYLRDGIAAKIFPLLEKARRASINPTSLTAERCAEVFNIVRHGELSDWEPDAERDMICSRSWMESSASDEWPRPAAYVLGDAQLVATYYLGHGGLVREGEAK